MINDHVIRDAIFLGIIWLAYFGIHSMLASLTMKHWMSRRYPSLMPAYRLAYNTLAGLLLGPPVWLLYNGHSVIFWEFSGISIWASNGLASLAIAGFLVSTRYYDGSEFIGIRQLKDRETRVEDQENFHLSPFHRFVRHPWYCFALVIIWTRNMDSLMLVTACLLTVYFFLGSKLEEKKLIYYYGNVYRRYCDMVPGLIPLPWKHITQKQAQALIHDSKAATGR